MTEGKPAQGKWWNRSRPHPHPHPHPYPSRSHPDDTAAATTDDQATAYGADDGVRADHPVPDDADGDFELQRPALPGVPDERPSGGGENEPTSRHSPYEPERPRPLHRPDPYGTPPYGEPGPWAPAPLVQHPGATPSQGTPAPLASPAPPSTPGATAPAFTDTSAPSTTSATPTAPGTADPTAAPAPGPVAPAAPETPATPTTPTTWTPASASTSVPDPDPWRRYDPWAAAGPASDTALQQIGPAPAAPLQQTGAAPLTKDQRRRRARRIVVTGAVVLAAVSGTVGGLVGAYLERNGGVGAVELPQAAEEDQKRPADSVAGIAARALPGVVTLHVGGGDAGGTGTGFVLDGRGHILTNNHVVRAAGDDGRISVTFSDGQTARAEVVGRDSGYDLAVVRVRGVRGLKPLPLGNSDNVRVGDPVVAIGAPFDLPDTVTSGIISAKERPITAGGEEGDGTDVSYVDALQTDAPINPGNSGGPLLDTRARVVGINSAIRAADSGTGLEDSQGGSIGLGFAIPVNQAKRVAEELIDTGHATHPVIGVTHDMRYPGDGARIADRGNDGSAAVIKGGPGAGAGLEPGDVITAVDGVRVHSGDELIIKTRAHRPGDRLRLTVRHGAADRKVTLVLGSSDGG